MIKVGEIRWTQNGLILAYVLRKADKDDIKRYSLINHADKKYAN